jgi:lysophospholipase L1-like esterase
MRKICTLILSLFLISSLTIAQNSLNTFKSGSLAAKRTVAGNDSVNFYNAYITKRNILSVSIKGQIGMVKDSTRRIFSIAMPAGTDLTKLMPTIIVSPGATIFSASGQTVDFSKGPVAYTVTAKNGSITWTIQASFTLPQITANNSNIQYVGRVDFSNPFAPAFSNPGVYIQANFKGTFCDMDMLDATNMNYVQVVIDNQPPKRLKMGMGSKIYRIADSLTYGVHKVLICKETEAGVGALTFLGFQCEGLLPVTDIPTRKIECYGNSITCGACMLNGDPCKLVDNGTNWNAANSAYLSYGALTARALNAQWQLTSVSGIGLIHSCCNMTFTMPDAYDRQDLNNSSSIKWDFTKYIPDVVTICLGQNDGSSIVAADTFKNTYIKFVKTIRSKYPDASIFLLTSPMADSSSSSTCLFTVMQTSLTNIVDSLNKVGDSKVYWVSLPHDLRGGCASNPHPNVAQHESIAAILETAIKQKMGW